MKISKKTLVKILTIVAIIIMIITICGNVFAITNPSTIKGKDTTVFNDFGRKIIGAIQAGGTIVSVAVLVVIGIKYMLGSAEEKAEYKKVMIPYIVGAILVFMASNIAGFIYSFTQA